MNKVIKILKKIKIRNLLLLIFLFIFNTYAWFTYASKVSSSLNVHVSSWNVEFLAGSGDAVTNLVIDVERIFPGMEDFTEQIEVHNKGETNVELTYQIKKISIMGANYEAGEDKTTAELEEMIKNTYPFTVIIENNSNSILGQNDTGHFTISVKWPFESGNDELDTFWGNKAYEYYALHPEGKSIQIELELIATQNNEQNLN